MKKILVIGSLVLASSIFGCQTKETSKKENENTETANASDFKNVNSKTFAEGLKIKGAQLIDVRTAEEFGKGNIAHARNMNVNGDSFMTEINDLSKDAPVMVYCKAGSRGEKASKILIENGFTNVMNLDGGMMAWENDKMPVEKKEKGKDGMTIAQYDALMAEHDIVLVDFNAPWCGPCRTMKPIVKQLEKEYKGKVHVVEINVDNAQELSAKMGIRSIPYFVINNKGKQVWQQVGSVPKTTLVNAIEAQLK